MVSISEQVTPSVDQLSSPESCLDSLNNADRVLIECGMIDVIKGLYSDMGKRGMSLGVDVNVSGSVEDAVDDVACRYDSFGQGIEPLDVKFVNVVRTSSPTPQIMYTLTKHGDELSPGVDTSLKLPRVHVNVNPLVLQISIYDENDLFTTRDFHHGKWIESSGKERFDETIVMMRGVFLESEGVVGRDE